MNVTVHRPGEGETIGGATTVTIKATGEDTGGSFYLGESQIEPGFAGPPPHRHTRLHDMFYVLVVGTGRLDERALRGAVALGAPTPRSAGRRIRTRTR